MTCRREYWVGGKKGSLEQSNFKENERTKSEFNCVHERETLEQLRMSFGKEGKPTREKAVKRQEIASYSLCYLSVVKATMVNMDE